MKCRVILITIAVCLLGVVLSGCVYRPDVQQGNIINNSDVKSLHTGMSANRVQSLLGAPVLVNIYRDNRLVYVYTFQHNYEKMKEKRLIIYFKNNKVINYWFDTKSPGDEVALPQP